MPEAFGFKAWISTEDGVVLPEYGIETDLEKKEIRCWIPSEAGKKFKVVWRNLAHYKKDTSGSITIDGIKVGGKIQNKRNSTMVAPIVKDYVSISPTSVRKFVFSSLKITDDDPLFAESSASQIGTISLWFREIKALETSAPDRPTLHEQYTIHERAKKGIVHSVGFAPEQKRPTNDAHRNVSTIQTFGTFVFKYRPLDILQANGIAPRDTPSETPTSPQPDITSGYSSKRKADALKEVEYDGNNDPSGEIESVRARLRKLERDSEKEMEELREHLRKLEGEQGNAKRVKTEPRSAIIPGEVIDLT